MEKGPHREVAAQQITQGMELIMSSFFAHLCLQCMGDPNLGALQLRDNRCIIICYHRRAKVRLSECMYGRAVIH